MTFRPEFIENIPEPMDMEPGVLYISIPFAIISHLCPCGCKNEIVTKLSPIRWKLTFDGETITLNPSIGNWDLPCQSHYWITKNEIEWAGKWSKERIERGRKENLKNLKKKSGY